MDIQVWSDVICPWCYIGKQRLENALAEFDTEATVTYRAYQLDPLPLPQPVPIRQVMAAKAGGAERAEQMFKHVAEIGAGEGLVLDFDRAIAANTFAAHRLIAWAAGQDRQADMLNALQRAHFADGINVGSLPALAGVAGSIGLDAATALAYLESDAGTNAVTTDLIEARELDITSVPTFVVNGKYKVQGAQESAALLDAFAEITRREGVNAGR
ncbi:DsbA family oxidoreductase [Actinoplanes regularis]|uniref:Predicted dithiol-disulfide isomerase, DsbA family n=1 Tax=Actinoplanes regularis TaxID=52697 RepID=A0A239JST6_9ACTN|nr:DsbA family oxidoreductase [Actinoplanes regularis]GIE92226.1 DSBA oxidoreductase [Actinoplanes regularis]SNT08890.1 Predicted dithiol-disulfide isomerase, DsbA family [Actinoplanes regularis]